MSDFCVPEMKSQVGHSIKIESIFSGPFSGENFEPL